MEKIINNIVTLGPIGYFPIGPGTLASIIAAILAFCINKFFGWQYTLILLLLVFLIGLYFVDLYVKKLKSNDPSEVVIDEVAGQLVASLMSGSSLGLNIFSFCLFRFFDILKPFPINKVENIKGSLGVMLDDLVAGMFSLALIIFIRSFYNF